MGLILLGILHWLLAGMVLHDLAARKHVLGGRKAPWAVLILFVSFIGSVLYLLCHPDAFFGDEE